MRAVCILRRGLNFNLAKNPTEIETEDLTLTFYSITSLVHGCLATFTTNPTGRMVDDGV